MIGDVSASGSVTGHTGPERSCEVGVRQGDRNDHVVLAVRGILPAPFGDAAFRRTLRPYIPASATGLTPA